MDHTGRGNRYRRMVVAVAGSLLAALAWMVAGEAVGVSAGMAPRGGRGGAPSPQGIVVDPLEIGVTGKPGASFSRDIRLINELPTAVAVSITPSAMVQQGRGDHDFVEADAYPGSCGSWISVQEAPNVLEPRTGATLRLAIQIPRQVKGDRLCAVMIEISPRGHEAGSGTGSVRARTTLVVRYAVKVAIGIDGGAVTPRVGLRDASWTVRGTPLIRAEVANLGEATTPVQAEAVVLDAAGRRILDRVTLVAERASRTVSVQDITPDGVVTFSGAVTRPMPAGTYVSRVVVRYGTARTLVATLPLRLEAATESSPQDGASPPRVRFEGRMVDVTLPPSGRRSLIVPLRNELSQPARITLAVRPHGRLCDGWTVAVTPELAVPAHSRTGVLLTVSPGPAVQTQCHAEVVGTLAGDAPGSAALDPFPVRATVTTMRAHAELSPVTLAGRQAAVTVTNTGPVALEPTVQALIETPGAAEPTRLPLLAPSRIILPGEARTFSATLPDELDRGRMHAVLTNDARWPLELTSAVTDVAPSR